MPKRAMLAVCLLLGSVAIVPTAHSEDAPPSTKPATRPVKAPPPLDVKNSVEVVIENRPFSFRVPKGWKAAPKSGEGVKVFLVPPPAREPTDPVKLFMAAVVGGGNPRVTLQEYAGKTRLAIQGRYGDVQFIHDEAVTMAGREVWLMVYDHPQKGVIDADHDDPKSVQRLARTQRVLSLHGEFAATLDFTCAPEDFDSLIRNVQRTFDSMKWTN